MGDTLDIAQTHRQQQLCSIQDLDLLFLIKAEHNCFVGWVEGDSTDVTALLDLTKVSCRACRRH